MRETIPACMYCETKLVPHPEYGGEHQQQAYKSGWLCPGARNHGLYVCPNCRTGKTDDQIGEDKADRMLDFEGVVMIELRNSDGTMYQFEKLPVTVREALTLSYLLDGEIWKTEGRRAAKRAGMAVEDFLARRWERWTRRGRQYSIRDIANMLLGKDGE